MIELISKVKPKNNGNFALMDAHDIEVDEQGKRLDEKLAELSSGSGGGGDYYEKKDAVQIRETMVVAPTFLAYEGNDYTQYQKGKIASGKNEEYYELNLPDKSGTIATTDDITGGGSGEILSINDTLFPESISFENFNMITILSAQGAKPVLITRALGGITGQLCSYALNGQWITVLVGQTLYKYEYDPTMNTVTTTTIDFGDIGSALDAIIEIQNSLTGGSE